MRSRETGEINLRWFVLLFVTNIGEIIFSSPFRIHLFVCARQGENTNFDPPMCDVKSDALVSLRNEPREIHDQLECTYSFSIAGSQVTTSGINVPPTGRKIQSKEVG